MVITIVIFVIVVLVLVYLGVMYISKHSEEYIDKENTLVPERWIDVDRYVPAREIASTPQKIPRKIFQTNREKVLPGMKAALDSWIALNPEYEYHYYPNDECREYIVTHIGERAAKAYDSLVPGAYKADLWRYCVLYAEGGVYADSAMVILRPLRELIGPNDEFIVPVDGGYDGGLYNAFICCTPKHPLLKRTIDLVIGRIERKEYGYRDLWPTGPIALGDAFNDMRGQPRGSPFKEGLYGGSIKLISRVSSGVNSAGYVNDLRGQPIILAKYRRHLKERKKWLTTPYPELWKDRKIYV